MTEMLSLLPCLLLDSLCSVDGTLPLRWILDASARFHVMPVMSGLAHMLVVCLDMCI